MVETGYENSDCSGDANVSMQIAGTFSGGVAVASPSGAKTIDLTYSTWTITPSSSAVADYMNTNSFCGVSTFAANTATNVMGKNCGGGAVNVGDVEPQIYKITGTTVQFGEDADGSSRSSSLKTRVYTKQ